MKKIILLLCCLLATGTLFFACSKDEGGKPDFKKMLTREHIAVTPEILVIKGGTLIPMDFTVQIPARFLPHKALLTLTPVLLCGDKEYKGMVKTWEGDGVNGGNDVIPYDKASTITLWNSFVYNEAMKNSYELYLEINIIDGPLTSFRIFVGKGDFQKSAL